LFVLLLLFWLILNGKVTIEILLIGAAISAALTFTARRVLKLDRRKELLFWRRLPKILLFLLYLTGQIVLANLQVIRLILKPGTGRPKLVWFRPKMQGDLTRLALANSITLTPGTITMDTVEEGGKCYYYVHWIDVSTADSEAAGQAIKGRLEKSIGRIWK